MDESKKLEISSRQLLKRYPRIITFFLFFVILFFSFATRFYDLKNPNYYVFDENYFIPMAQKYIRGEYFGDPHPPTGKLLITAGAYLYPDNAPEADPKTESASNPSENLIKYRIVPAFFAALLPLLVFMIIYIMTRSNLLSFIGGFLVTFDNAILVHGRLALFDEILFSFVLISLILSLLYIKLSKGDAKNIFKSKNILIRILLLIGAGIFSGLAISTKFTGLTSVAFLSLALIYRTYKDKFKLSFKSIGLILLQIIIPFAIILGTFYASFAVHFKLLHSPGVNLEEFSQEFQNCFQGPESDCRASLFALTNESVKWSFNYEKLVPKVDFCKEGEMGSTPTQWPLMGRAIPYAFSNHAEIPLTTVSYIYLTGNPAVWYSGLLAVIVGFSLVVTSFFVQRSLINKRIFLILLAYIMNYIPYFFIERVMYFYHYFPALIFSLILLALLLQEFYKLHLQNKVRLSQKILFLAFYLMLTFTTFLLYSPLSYNKKVDVSYVEKIIFSKYWNLQVDPYNYNNTE